MGKRQKQNVANPVAEPVEVKLDNPVAVWVKYPVYINDTQRLKVGFYVVEASEVTPRLRSHKSDAVEILEGELSPKKIAIIGRWAKIDTDVLEDSEIVKRLAKNTLELY